MATYLDFENKIHTIQDELEAARVRVDEHAIEILQKELDKETEKLYKNLSDYQKLQLARHPDRPYALDYVHEIMPDAYEIHGDRAFRDDEAIVCFIGTIAKERAVIIGEQKGRGTKNKLRRNFGMPHPEGYRKALRVAKMAEKFQIPVLLLVDTPGAYPGIGAEERGQSEAIARNLYEFSAINTPTVSVVIGEGGSGGALAIGVADKLAMMRYSVFSVISPEGCAAILWDDPEKAEQATKAMKITSEQLHELGLIDDILEEPMIGAHRDKQGAAAVIRDYFLENIRMLANNSNRQQERYDKLMRLGRFVEF